MFRTAIVALLALAACAGATADDPSVVVDRVDRALDVPHMMPSPPSAPGSGEPNLFAVGDRVHLSWLEPAGGDEWAFRFATLEGDKWSEPRDIARVGLDSIVRTTDLSLRACQCVERADSIGAGHGSPNGAAVHAFC